MGGALMVTEMLPFTVALGVMLLIALTEVAGTIFGISPSGLVDQLIPDFDADVDVDLDMDAGFDADVDSDVDSDVAGEPGGALSQVLGWLCVGRVPVLVLLVAFLTIFGLAGLMLQGLSKSVAGYYLPALIASVATLFVSLPPTRWLALGLARIMPKEETDAVSTSTFVGRIAVITLGEARADMPAQAKLRDVHGQTHYVMVEPDDARTTLQQGAEVLLLRQTSSGRFAAKRNDNELLSNS